MNEVTVRKYRLGDARAMFSLDRECFAEAFRFSRPAMRRFAEARGAISLVAIGNEDSLAGFVVVHQQVDRGVRYGYVVTLDVAPAWRRRGLATQLLQQVERQLAEGGVKTMALHVHAGNEAALRLYEREEYQRKGVEPDFYGTGLHAFVYSKRL